VSHEFDAELAPEDLKKTTRDPEALRAALEGWLVTKFPADAKPSVAEVSSPSETGMSSETLLFDAQWEEGGKPAAQSFVARVEPDPNDCPVFPLYDLEGQFKLLAYLREHSRIPVPVVRWLELDPSHLGAPFFVMERAEGRVPPDVLPYTFGSWVTEATPDERRQLQDSSVGILADLHEIDASVPALDFLEFDLPGATPLERHFENQRRYYQWMRGDRRHPIIEQTFAWLETNWPSEEGETVVSWGDSRIGNVMYDGFTPSAVLDWEMAARGPRELDVGWMIFLHCFFQEITTMAGQPGLADFMQPAEVVATYEARTGKALKNIDWFQVYAGLRHGIVMARVHARSVHFGQGEWPDDIDSVIYHRPTLERMIDGSWWK
jgi:aminoglycoside phosphotransferase (APT) family kinase protein